MMQLSDTNATSCEYLKYTCRSRRHLEINYDLSELQTNSIEASYFKVVIQSTQTYFYSLNL